MCWGGLLQCNNCNWWLVVEKTVCDLCAKFIFEIKSSIRNYCLRSRRDRCSDCNRNDIIEMNCNCCNCGRIAKMIKTGCTTFLLKTAYALLCDDRCFQGDLRLTHGTDLLKNWTPDGYADVPQMLWSSWLAFRSSKGLMTKYLRLPAKRRCSTLQ